MMVIRCTDHRSPRLPPRRRLPGRGGDMYTEFVFEPSNLLVASATIERGLWVLCVLLGILLVARMLRRRTPAAGPLAIDTATERRAMLVVVVWVLVSRLVGYASAQQPRWYFAGVSILHIADLLRDPGAWRHWLDTFRNLQVIYEHESPIQAPVAAVVQLVLGPSIELPTIVGTVWAVLAVLVAWRLGRIVETPAYGVLFAALVAVAPLQIAWARLGGIYIGASAAVLCVAWTAWVAGQRGGALAAFASGCVAWSGVYFYYPARVTLGLVFVALWGGWRRSRGTLRRLAVLTFATAAGLAACMWLAHAMSPSQSLWPSYGTYLGTRGETRRRGWLASSWGSIRQQGALAVRNYLWSERMADIVPLLPARPSRWAGSALQPGMTSGGLVLLPVLLLGALGLVRGLRHPVEHGLWLALAAAGFLSPLLGYPSARRFLVLDVAWCAFAALGLLTLLESPLLAPVTTRGRWRWAGALLAGLGLWSAAALALSAALLPSQLVHIPFAESGFGDGATCLGCVRTARDWEREIEEGHMVVFFDTDVYRENATFPGGIWLYGKTAALAAGRPDLLLDYYALVSNFDPSPPRPGAVAQSPPDDVAAALAARIDAARPQAIDWWFIQPNAWERRLADVLVAAGSTRTFPPPRATWGADRTSVSADPILVETPWQRRGEALSALRALVDPPPTRRCVRLEHVATQEYGRWTLLVAPVRMTEDDRDDPPRWAVASRDDAEVWGVQRAVSEPVAFQYEVARDGTASVNVVDVGGVARAWTPTGDEYPQSPIAGPRPPGHDCQRLKAGEGWVVDPVAGTLHLPGNPPATLALGAVGLSVLDGQPVVATADQSLWVFDPIERKPVRQFPALTAPTRRLHFGECAMLASGQGWIASLDHLRGDLYVYDSTGLPLGRVSLARAVGTAPRAVHSIRGAGNYLGVGHDTAVTTLRLVRDRTCPAPGSP